MFRYSFIPLNDYKGKFDRNTTQKTKETTIRKEWYKHMGKINNIVRVVQFEKDTDLYFNIDRLMSSDGERWKVSKPYRVKNINLIDNSHALVYLEEDLSVVQVHFFYD